MTQKEKRIKIAEACGIQVKMFRFLVPYHDGQKVYRSKFKTKGEAEKARELEGKWALSDVEEYDELSDVPDYFNDLNTCYIMEKLIESSKKRYSYYLNLGRNGGNNHEWTKIHATATDRAEAFGRTLNLW